MTRPTEQLPAGATDLAWQRVAYLWSPGGYERAGLTKELGKVRILTPPTTLRVLEAGYRPWVHPSVMSGRDQGIKRTQVSRRPREQP